MSLFRWLVAGMILSVLWIGSVKAVPITIDHTISASHYVSNGGASYTGTINISDSLDSLLYTSPYDINSATLRVTYSDDATDGGYIRSGGRSDTSGWSVWRNSWFNGNWGRTFANFNENEYTTEREYGRISIASGLANQSLTNTVTNAESSFVYTRGTPTYTKNLGIQTHTGWCEGFLSRAPRTWK